MKKNLFKVISGLIFSALAFWGCQKDIKELSAAPETELQLKGDNNGNNNKCRLVSNQGDDNLLQTFHYNNKGLVDQWNYSVTAYNDRLAFEYDRNDKVVKARYYYNGEFLYTLIPEYQGNRIIKETWFVGETNIIDDQAFFTYNRKGQLIRKESFLYDYYILYKYDAVGNAYKQDWFYTDGTQIYDLTYYFTKPVKNPMLLVPGLARGIAWQYYELSPWRQTGLKAIAFDEGGNPFTFLDQEPRRSILRAGRQNYAVYQNFYDRVSESWYEQTWSYDNCGRNDNCDDLDGNGKRDCEENNDLSKSPVSTALANNKNNRIAMPVLHGPMKKIKEQIIELRKQFKK